MTVLSPRLAAAAVALLLVTAAPVWFHALTAPTQDTCGYAAGFFGAGEIGGARVVPWEQMPPRIEGVQAKLSAGTGHPLSVRVFRTFEPSLLYGSPIKFGFETLLYLQPTEVRELRAGDDVLPAHFSSYLDRTHSRVEAYVYAQRGMPVRHPVQSGLALGLDQLTGGTHSLDVFIVSGFGSRAELADLERAAERWLVDAWRQLEAACGSR